MRPGRTARLKLRGQHAGWLGEVHPLVRAQLLLVGAIGTLGAPGLFRRACLEGDCCSEFWEQYAAPLSKGVGCVCVYSRSDGIVDWHACLDPCGEHVEVKSSHIGMAVNPGVYRAIAKALADFRALGSRRRASLRLADAA